MSTLRNTYYSKEWEDVAKYPDCAKWVVGNEGATTFGCKYCPLRKPLQLKNMGIKKEGPMDLVKGTRKKLQITRTRTLNSHLFQHSLVIHQLQLLLSRRLLSRRLPSRRLLSRRLLSPRLLSPRNQSKQL